MTRQRKIAVVHIESAEQLADDLASACHGRARALELCRKVIAVLEGEPS